MADNQEKHLVLFILGSRHPSLGSPAGIPHHAQAHVWTGIHVCMYRPGKLLIPVLEGAGHMCPEKPRAVVWVPPPSPQSTQSCALLFVLGSGRLGLFIYFYTFLF